MRLLLLTSFLATTALAEGQWTLLRTEADGLRLESREVGSSRFPEFRVTTHSEANLSALTEAVWRWNAHGVEAQMVQKRTVLTESARERLVWAVVRPPVVSPRESFIRFQRKGDATHSLISFASESGTSPAGTEAVRVALVRGLWRFEADPQGGTRVEHQMLTDPGGQVPAWIARGPQGDMMVQMVREALKTAKHQ